MLRVHVLLAFSLIAWETQVLLPAVIRQMHSYFLHRSLVRSYAILALDTTLDFLFEKTDECPLNYFRHFQAPRVDIKDHSRLDFALNSFFADILHRRGPVSLQLQMNAYVAGNVTNSTLYSFANSFPSEECALRQLLILQNFECAMGTGMVENFVGQCQANNDACVVAFPESHTADSLECVKSLISNVSLTRTGFVFFDGSVPSKACRTITLEAYNEAILRRARHWSGRIQYRERLCA